MKLTYAPTEQYTFVLEGTIEEVLNFINLITHNETPAATTVAREITRAFHDSVNATVLSQLSTVVPATATAQPIDTNDSVQSTAKRHNRGNDTTQTSDFLKSIYLYEPNPNNDSGRGAFIAQQILKGSTLNIEKLARRAHGNRDSVFNAVRRMANAGAVLDISANTIRLVSLPEPPYSPKKYKRRTPSTSPADVPVVTVPATKSTSTVPTEMAQTLSAIKLV